VKKDPRVYLAHILECIQKIELFTTDGKSRFLSDVMVRDAVVRNLEVIGEAAKRIDDSYRTGHREIPWRTLGGLRDVLIHQYEGVDPEKVWAIRICRHSSRPSPRYFLPWTSSSANSPERRIRRRNPDAVYFANPGRTMAETQIAGVRRRETESWTCPISLGAKYCNMCDTVVPELERDMDGAGSEKARWTPGRSSITD
jgi:uncharacterized protein with HEPN domain